MPRNVIVVSGDSYKKENLYISYTIGELIVGEMKNQNIILDNSFSDNGFLTTVKINDVQGVSIDVYPNPVKNILRIVDINGEYEFYLFDSLGQIIQQGSLNTNMYSIFMGNQPAGNYILSILEKGIKIKSINIIKK